MATTESGLGVVICVRKMGFSAKLVRITGRARTQEDSDGWVDGWMDGWRWSVSPSRLAGRYAVTVASANHGGNRIAKRLAEHRIDVRDWNRCLGENVRGETIGCSMGQRERERWSGCVGVWA